MVAWRDESGTTPQTPTVANPKVAANSRKRQHIAKLLVATEQS
jgi:hypothetical protein